MNEKDIITLIKTQFASAKLEWVEAPSGDNYLVVPSEALRDVVKYIKETEALYFDYLVNLSAFDATEHIEVTYHFYSYTHRHKLVLKVKAVRLNGEVPTITDLYGTANFQEREVFDLLGVRFASHPNLARILLPPDFKGHPLLKDYQEEAQYNGIETTRASLL
ncbi:MAG: NADH-quinone oxidoreductase subunit C [Deltaproteobacteria bacterium]|nr:NADH-quinone oxidoreductase subunit C [Deltaproteobacteria bacterium]